MQIGLLVRAVDSRNAGVTAATGGIANSSGEHVETDKGTWMYDGLEIRRINSKIVFLFVT